MENEIQDKQLILTDNDANYFKLDFPNQKLEGNKSFEKYKNDKLKELGYDSKLFHCKNDNLYFYISKRDCEAIPLYYKKCPLCKNYICYFCHRHRATPPVIENSSICCLKLKLNYLFKIKGFEYFKEFNTLTEKKKNDFIMITITFFIPIVILFLIFILASNVLFHGLFLKDKKWRNNNNLHGERYYDYFKNYSFGMMMTLELLQAICYSICYTIYFIYFNVFILIISLFSKFYPLKYIIGIFENSI
jgi:hypothetical protein